MSLLGYQKTSVKRRGNPFTFIKNTHMKFSTSLFIAISALCLSSTFAAPFGPISSFFGLPAKTKGYTFKQYLAQGGFGIVFKAKDSKGRKVAIKVPKNVQHVNESFAREKEIMEVYISGLTHQTETQRSG
jgi:serine/threonine protein kinase